jgi:hypothetical protein
MFYLDLDELADIQDAVTPWSVNRFNIVSFHDADHLDRRPGSTKRKVLEFLRRDGVDLPMGKVYLLTSCRILGYVFNPISLYYCHDRSGDLRAVVAEVGNTFGEQYLYLLRTSVSTPGVARGALRCRGVRKAMHVSPFLSMDATYDFQLPVVSNRLSVGIVEREHGRHVLDAQLWGTRVSLTTASLSRILLTYPLMTLATVATIHLEALRLYLKRVPLHRKPARSQEQRAQEDTLAELGES